MFDERVRPLAFNRHDKLKRLQFVNKILKGHHLKSSENHFTPLNIFLQLYGVFFFWGGGIFT
jgi:hypothetical protein